MGKSSRNADSAQSGSSTSDDGLPAAHHLRGREYIEGSQVLLSYLDNVLHDPASASIEVDALPAVQRPLAIKIEKLGSFVREVQGMTQDLARGKIERGGEPPVDHANPLISSLDGIRSNLAQALAVVETFSAGGEAPTCACEGEGSPNEFAEALNEAAADMNDQRRQLEQSAYTDALTGVGNKAAYNRSLELLWGRGGIRRRIHRHRQPEILQRPLRPCRRRWVCLQGRRIPEPVLRGEGRAVSARR